MEQFVSYHKFKLHYLEFGEGEEYLLAFHGFGCSAEDFKIFEESLGKKYRIISFYLFHHGLSEYPQKRIEKHTLRNRELKAIINTFLEEKNIDRFSLMGYSIGGKIALACMEYFSEKINSVYLFAPDGLKPSPWVKLVTGFKPGKAAYKFIIKHPSLFFSFIGFLKDKKLLHERLYKFVKTQMESEARRLQIFKVWMTFSRIKPDLKNIQKILSDYKINMHLFFGKYDRVIQPKTGRRFVKLMKGRAKLHIIYAGHRLVSEKTNNYLLKQKDFIVKGEL